MTTTDSLSLVALAILRPQWPSRSQQSLRSSRMPLLLCSVSIPPQPIWGGEATEKDIIHPRIVSPLPKVDVCAMKRKWEQLQHCYCRCVDILDRHFSTHCDADRGQQWFVKMDGCIASFETHNPGHRRAPSQKGTEPLVTVPLNRSPI